MTIKVEKAAIKIDETIVSVPRPGRHHNCIRKAIEKEVYKTDNIQGFVLSDGRFVGREEALEVAREAGQVGEDLIGSVLTSEDLW